MMHTHPSGAPTLARRHRDDPGDRGRSEFPRTITSSSARVARSAKKMGAAECPSLADIVAKRFWVSEEATLLQDAPPMRKVDSKICSLRFDCCAPRPLLLFANRSLFW
jgi:hypothetical protein